MQFPMVLHFGFKKAFGVYKCININAFYESISIKEACTSGIKY